MANLKKLKKSIILFNAIISEQLTFANPIFTSSLYRYPGSIFFIFFSFFFQTRSLNLDVDPGSLP